MLSVSANLRKQVTPEVPPTGGIKIENTKNYNWSEAKRH